MFAFFYHHAVITVVCVVWLASGIVFWRYDIHGPREDRPPLEQDDDLGEELADATEHVPLAA